MAKAVKGVKGKRAAKAAPPAEDDAECLLTGQFLIAMPGMNTSQFAQTVIYLCAHTPDGAMGIVLNRPLASPSFDDLLRQLDVEPVPPVRRIALFRGGPVDSARGFVLHTADWVIPWH
jgi:putative transcriptional regulator